MAEMNEALNTEELDWLAFQYIAGEWNDAETAQFEERLAVDQAAREAIAAAVELTQTLLTTAAVQSVPAADRSKEARRRWSWAAVSVAALCVMCIASLLLLSDPVARLDELPIAGELPGVIEPSEFDAGTADRLMGLWNDGGLTPNGQGAESADTIVGNATAMTTANDDLSATSEIVIPDWLIAAVSADLTLEKSKSGESSKEK